MVHSMGIVTYIQDISVVSYTVVWVRIPVGSTAATSLACACSHLDRLASSHLDRVVVASLGVFVYPQFWNMVLESSASQLCHIYWGAAAATYCRCRLLSSLAPRFASGCSPRLRRVAFLQRIWGLMASARRADGTPCVFGFGQPPGSIDHLFGKGQNLELQVVGGIPREHTVEGDSRRPHEVSVRCNCGHCREWASIPIVWLQCTGAYMHFMYFTRVN